MHVGLKKAPDSNVTFRFSMPALGLHTSDTEFSSEGAGQVRSPQEPLCPSTTRQAVRPTDREVMAGSPQDDGPGDITSCRKGEQTHQKG